MEKYKLRITIEWFKSKMQKTKVIRSFVWINREDAMACKKLMEKAHYEKGTSIEFVAFTEETPLE